jgi:ketosteroid isomerase-like protein
MTMQTDADALDEATARVRQLMADADRKRQEIALAPKHLFVSATTAAAAMMGAGAAILGGALALAKYLGG